VDYGIDAEAEVVTDDNEYGTGALTAAQILDLDQSGLRVEIPHRIQELGKPMLL